MDTVRFHGRRESQFKLIVVGLTMAALMSTSLLVKPLAKLKGKGLNSRAWRASYYERHLPVPSGPREGWWGTSFQAVHDGTLGMIQPERHVPGYFEVNRWGMQSAPAGPNPRARLLIIGASVAAGGYASNLGRTYFHQLGHLLSTLAYPVDIIVYATGGWTSANELQALRVRGLSLHPDAVLFLNGMNDLLLYKEWPEEKRVQQYLLHMREARDLALARHVKVIFAPQPFLPEKKVKTGLEVLILAESYPHPDRLVQAHAEMMRGLQALTIPGKVYLVDCSGAFDGYGRTVFADIFHFSDIGHAILARHLARGLAPIFLSENHRPASNA